MNQKRPMNLALGSMKYPPMAIASILHRISGLVLFLLMPIMLYFLSLSLGSQTTFEELQRRLLHPCHKALLWAFSTAFIYHIFAGIRHLLMDMGIGEHLETGRRSALVVIVLAIIAAIFLGIWIC